VNAAAEKSRQWLLVVVILFAAAAVRLLAAAVLPDQGTLLPDVAIYRESARQLFADFKMSSIFQMPLYPALIGVFGPGVGQHAIDIALSVITVWLIYELSLELFADRRAAILASIAAACYPPLIYFAVVGLSETLFITLVLAAFLCWYRERFTLAAIFSVLAILTRPVFDLAAPLLIIFFALFIHRQSLAQTVRHLCVYAVIYVALMAPWWIHNYRSYGHFVRLTAGFGTALYAGNNPLNKSGGGNMGVDYDIGEFANISDPVVRDRALRDAALLYIRDHPKRFLELAGLKFIRMWRLWPAHEGYSSRSTILISVASFLPILLLSALGVYYARRNLGRLSPILLFGLGYTAIHMVLVGTIRYRLPLEPFMVILAGIAASCLIRQYAPAREGSS
jgi:4-amino-4-deoxy-L-arabinose transferase-like glycosyltransferase